MRRDLIERLAQKVQDQLDLKVFSKNTYGAYESRKLYSSDVVKSAIFIALQEILGDNSVESKKVTSMNIKFTYTHDQILKLIQDDLYTRNSILLKAMKVDFCKHQEGLVYIDCEGDLG